MTSASIAKVRDDGNKSEGEGIEELNLEDETQTEVHPEEEPDVQQ